MPGGTLLRTLKLRRLPARKLSSLNASRALLLSYRPPTVSYSPVAYAQTSVAPDAPDRSILKTS